MTQVHVGFNVDLDGLAQTLAYNLSSRNILDLVEMIDEAMNDSEFSDDLLKLAAKLVTQA